MADKIEIVNTWKLSNIFNELESGNLKIPRFQREYVWEKTKIVALLNSIYHHYPIGSFFIWEAGEGYAHFCQEITELNLPLKPQFGNYQFILDGQQRITSLYISLKKVVFNNIDYSIICFNLEKKEFKIRTLKTEKNNIPAWKLFNSIEYGDVYADYVLSDRKLADVWKDCQERFTAYPISLIKSKGMDLDEVVEIFECINQGGKRLKLHDLVHASTWSSSFDLREKIKLFNNESRVKSFGEIVTEVFIQSLSLNKFGDCKNKNQLDLTAEICLEIWDSTVKSLRLAIDYVKSLGVKAIEFIPYPSFLAIIQYYFYKSNRTSIQVNHNQYVINWFWTASFSQRYTSSTLSKMKEDADWILKIIANEIIDNVFTCSISIKDIIKIRMNMSSAIKNAIFCLYAMENPADFSNGQAVTLDNSFVSKSNAKEKHHFFPYSLKTRFNATESEINSIVNLAFISQSLNREILNALPSDYLDKYSKLNNDIANHLNSHFIGSDEINAIKANDYSTFLHDRANAILDRIKEKTALEMIVIPDDDVEDDVEVDGVFTEEAVNE